MQAQQEQPKPHGAAPDTGPRPQDAATASDERILFFPEPCTRLAGGACTRCQTVCPAQAISFTKDGEPRIDHAACTRCGICIGVCDSFASSAITTVDHARRLERLARAHGGRLYLCCNEDLFEGLHPAPNVVPLPCLSALSPEFAAYLLACDIELALCHDLSYCEDCTAGGALGGKLWQRSFQLAQEWTGRRTPFADAVPETARLSDTMAAPNRRELFTGVVGAAAEVASGEYRARKSTAVEDFLARRERMHAQVAASRANALYLSEESREASRQSRFARKILMDEARLKLACNGVGAEGETGNTEASEHERHYHD